MGSVEESEDTTPSRDTETRDLQLMNKKERQYVTAGRRVLWFFRGRFSIINHSYVNFFPKYFSRQTTSFDLQTITQFRT